MKTQLGKLMRRITELFRLAFTGQTLAERKMEGDLDLQIKLNKRLSKQVWDLENENRKMLKANGPMAETINALERMLMEQARSLQAHGMGRFALPIPSLLRSTRPELFNKNGDFSMENLPDGEADRKWAENEEGDLESPMNRKKPASGARRKKKSLTIK